MKIAGSLATLALAVGSTLVLPNTATAATCTWSSSTLSGPAGAFSTIHATDNSGGWAGTAYFSFVGNHVIAWKNGTITDYGEIGSSSANVVVVDENRTGALAVNVTDGGEAQTKSEYRISGGQWQQLAPLPGGTRPEVVSINDAGDVYGTTQMVNGSGITGTVVVRWPANQATPVQVAGLPFDTTMIDLDDDGTLLVGTPDPKTGGPVPHLLRNGILTALPPLANGQTTNGDAIANGRVAGDVITKSIQLIGTVWESNLAVHSLPNLQEGMLINRNDLVVGTLTGSGATNGVWRNGTLEYSFGSTSNYVALGAVSDDGTFGGDINSVPTVWRCS